MKVIQEAARLAIEQQSQLEKSREHSKNSSSFLNSHPHHSNSIPQASGYHPSTHSNSCPVQINLNKNCLELIFNASSLTTACQNGSSQLDSTNVGQTDPPDDNLNCKSNPNQKIEQQIRLVCRENSEYLDLNDRYLFNIENISFCGHPFRSERYFSFIVRKHKDSKGMDEKSLYLEFLNLYSLCADIFQPHLFL